MGGAKRILLKRAHAREGGELSGQAERVCNETKWERTVLMDKIWEIEGFDIRTASEYIPLRRGPQARTVYENILEMLKGEHELTDPLIEDGEDVFYDTYDYWADEQTVEPWVKLDESQLRELPIQVIQTVIVGGRGRLLYLSDVRVKALVDEEKGVAYVDADTHGEICANA